MTAIPKQGPVVAIDGPAGTGKSSATKSLAEILGFVHVDTGAIYRAVAWLLMQKRVAGPGVIGAEIDEAQATELARSVHLEFRRVPSLSPANRLFADGRDLTDFIRTPEVSMVSSRVSAVPGVRSALLGLQRRLGCVGKTILEGRDIGTVVFPDADVKFFLTASADERAKRRLLELQQKKGPTPSFEELKRQMLARDEGDSTRAVAPLRRADDAIEVDTSAMTLEQVVTFMERVVRERLGREPGERGK